ncbi:MAG: glycosyltransferase family 2 protein [Candidatus Micrarchaeota archaeon]|nr:glycosyltransferase family 2 protein [Candidatus Micrarchaeota archaeon]
MPYFSVITPTLDRASLAVCLRSLDRQTFDSWEHIVWLDAEIASSHLEQMNSGKRSVVVPGMRFNDFGNTPRNLAWQFASGDWIIYLDDDNRLADKDALQRIHDCLAAAGEPNVGIFPIIRHGVRFFNLPPRLCFFDTANMVVKREIGRWPAGPEYVMDGLFIERLVAEYSYVAFPECAPTICVPVSSEGK